MAPSCRSPKLWPTTLLCTLGIATAHAAPALSGGCEQPIHLDAASSEVDYRSNTVVFADVQISQCATRVQADRARATGLNFANSRWTFDGHVHITGEQQGSLQADTAVVEFRDNHILRATVTGRPAQFEQLRSDAQRMAHGHADEITYDVNEGTVRLVNDAWLSDGQSEISGPLVVYNIRGQRVQASAAPNTPGRIHITIQPHAPPSGSADTPRADGQPPQRP
ncbi:MAG: lipopolysaccharide transport periplasmic protein LptA [Gammaproteobacteria bacterium]|nr:lipopolysaccharide transport periplasmic protein LptA [Gammaproteobacteria bacterium]MBV9622238.1 lipopolysaccharide transport periplasmic protein LptA [Gammaproteobacteria bacterium]